eukprot:m.1565883 g.1565883  ORF g.1565883 m.1565883 type:complete len:125 (+) comp25288_c1_seq19:4488-4862(+)
MVQMTGAYIARQLTTTKPYFLTPTTPAVGETIGCTFATHRTQGMYTSNMSPQCSRAPQASEGDPARIKTVEHSTSSETMVSSNASPLTLHDLKLMHCNEPFLFVAHRKELANKEYANVLGELGP